LELNYIHNENCLYTMERMPSDTIDLTITSPPYDNMRKYENKTYFDFP
jgi:site-specific DNA-methyltransferase (adenine-specific)